MGLRPTYCDENPQRPWGGPSAQAWRTHSCVPRRDVSRRLLADATVQAQAPRESRRGTHECGRHVSPRSFLCVFFVLRLLCALCALARKDCPAKENDVSGSIT